MDDRQTVFLAEFISEDTNPWDARDREPLVSTFEAAVEAMKWATKDSDEGEWVSTDTYGGGNAKTCWKWCENRDEEGNFYDDGSGYGFYIWKEYVD
jgi:hypothetical protein